MPSGIKIGDVFMAMLLDSRDFAASAAKEGAKAGDSAGAAMSKGIKGRLTDLFKGGIFVGAGIELGRQALHGLETAVTDVINVIPDMIRKGEDFALNVEDITKKTGASAETASRFAGTLSYLGIATDGLGMMLKTLSVQVVTNEANFDKLGIKVRTSANGPLLDTITILGNVRSYLSTAGDGATKLSLATTLLGRSAGNLIEYLNLTDAQAAALNETMDALGVTMSEKAVQDVEGATRESRLLGLAWQGVSNVLTAEVVPVIRQVLGAAFQFIVDHGAEVRQTLVDITNAALGLMSGLLGIEGVTPFQAQLDGLAGSSDNATLSFEQWAQQNSLTIPVIDKTAAATKAATGAIDNEIKSIDKQIDRSKAADTAAENQFGRTMRRLGAVYQAQLDALDLQEKQDAAAQRAFDLNERLNQAQLDLAAAQKGDKGVVDAKAVSDAMKAVADIRAEQAQAALQAQRDDERARLQSTKDFIAEQASLASDTTVTQTTKVKTFTHREDVLTGAINVAKEKGDAATVADLTARLEAVKTAKARTEQANRAIDRQAELGDIKTQVEAQRAAIASTDSAEITANKAKLADMKAAWQTYLADQLAGFKGHTEGIAKLITGDPKTGTGLGGAFTKAFADAEASGESLRSWIDDVLVPSVAGLVDGISKIVPAMGGIVKWINDNKGTVELALILVGASTGNIAAIGAALAMSAANLNDPNSFSPIEDALGWTNKPQKAGPAAPSHPGMHYVTDSPTTGYWVKDSTVPGKAAGGLVRSPVLSWLAERRPEYVIPDVPDAAARLDAFFRGPMTGMSAGGSQTIEVPVYLDGEVITRVVARHLADEYQR